MDIISKELGLIEKYLSGLITEENIVLKNLSKFLMSPSKRIRSKLAVLYLKSNNIEINDDVIKLLAAGEIFHNASLLHDDIIDDCDKRRGADTIGKTFSPKISILCGDLLVSLGIKILYSLNNSEIAELFTDCFRKMCKSEINQYILRGKIPTEDEYINICKGKTAELFKVILKGVCILTGNNSVNAEFLGENFGILFQLKNDLTPYSAISDKKNKIRTAFDIFGIEKTMYLTDNYKERLKRAICLYPNKEYANALLKLTEEI